IEFALRHDGPGPGKGQGVPETAAGPLLHSYRVRNLSLLATNTTSSSRPGRAATSASGVRGSNDSGHFRRADAAGQITYANLYAAGEPITDPTEKEAQEILEISFRYGHSRDTWIVCTPEKKTWTVGTSWKRPYKFTEHVKRQMYHGICQHP